MVSEIAFACVLLVGAGLLVRSFLRVLDVNLGFQPEHAAAVRVDPGSAVTPRRRRQNAYFDEVLRRVRAIPGVDGRRTHRRAPAGPQSQLGRARERARSTRRGKFPNAFVRVVSDGYLEGHGHPADRRPRSLRTRQPVERTRDR